MLMSQHISHLLALNCLFLLICCEINLIWISECVHHRSWLGWVVNARVWFGLESAQIFPAVCDEMPSVEQHLEFTSRRMMIRTAPSSWLGQARLSAKTHNLLIFWYRLTELRAWADWAGQRLVNCQGPPLRLSLTAQLLIIGEKHKKWLLTLSLKQMLKLIYDCAPNVSSNKTS